MAKVFYIRTIGTEIIEKAMLFDLIVDGCEYRDEFNQEFNRVPGTGAGLHYYYKYMCMMIREGEFSLDKEGPYLVTNENGTQDPFQRQSIRKKIKPQWENVFKGTSIKIEEGKDENGGNALRKYSLKCSENEEYIFRINSEIYVLSGGTIERVYNLMNKVEDYAPVDYYKKLLDSTKIEQELFPRLQIGNAKYTSLKEGFFERKEKILYVDAPRRYGKTFSLCSVAMQARKYEDAIEKISPQKVKKKTMAKKLEDAYTVVFLSAEDLVGTGDFNLAEEIFKHSTYGYKEVSLRLLDKHIRKSPIPWLILIDDLGALPVERQNRILYALGLIIKENENVRVIITTSVSETFDMLGWDEEFITETEEKEKKEPFTLGSVTARGRLLKLTYEQIPQEVRSNKFLQTDFCTPELCAYFKNDNHEEEIKDYYDLFARQYRTLRNEQTKNQIESFLQPLKMLAFLKREEEEIGKNEFSILYKRVADYSAVAKIYADNNPEICRNLLNSDEFESLGNNIYRFRRYDFSKKLAASFYVDYILSFGVPTRDMIDMEDEEVRNSQVDIVLEKTLREIIHDILPCTGEDYQKYNEDELERIKKRMNIFYYAEFLFVELYERIFKYKSYYGVLAEKSGLSAPYNSSYKTIEGFLNDEQKNEQKQIKIEREIAKAIKKAFGSKVTEEKKETIASFAKQVVEESNKPEHVVSYLTKNKELRSLVLMLGLFVGFDRGTKAMNYLEPMVNEFLDSEVEYIDMIQVLNACLYTGIRQTEDEETLKQIDSIYEKLLKNYSYSRRVDENKYLLDEEDREEYCYDSRLIKALVKGNQGAIRLQLAKLIREKKVEGTIDDEMEQYDKAKDLHKEGFDIKNALSKEAGNNEPLGLIRSRISSATVFYWKGRAEKRRGNITKAIKCFEDSIKEYDEALKLDEKPVEDSEPHVIFTRQAGAMFELYKLEEKEASQIALGKSILDCLVKAVDSFTFYVKIKGKINRAALERYRIEIEQCVDDIRNKYHTVLRLSYDKAGRINFNFINTVLTYYNYLNPYNQLAFDTELLEVVDV